jgi:hypothetical protein
MKRFFVYISWISLIAHFIYFPSVTVFILVPVTKEQYFSIRFEVDSVVVETARNSQLDVRSSAMRKLFQMRHIKVKLSEILDYEKLMLAIEWDDLRDEELVVTPFSLSVDLLGSTSTSLQSAIFKEIIADCTLDCVDFTIFSKSVLNILAAFNFYEKEKIRLGLEKLKSAVFEQSGNQFHPKLLWKYAFLGVLFLKGSKLPFVSVYPASSAKLRNDYWKLQLSKVLFLILQIHYSNFSSTLNVEQLPTRTEFPALCERISFIESKLSFCELVNLRKRVVAKFLKAGVPASVLIQIVCHEEKILFWLKYLYRVPSFLLGRIGTFSRCCQ